MDAIFTTAIRRQNFLNHRQADSNSVPIPSTGHSTLLFNKHLGHSLGSRFSQFWKLASYSQWNQNKYSDVQHIRKNYFPCDWLVMIIFSAINYFIHWRVYQCLLKCSKGYFYNVESHIQNYKWLILYFSYKWQWILFIAYQFQWSLYSPQLLAAAIFLLPIKIN